MTKRSVLTFSLLFTFGLVQSTAAQTGSIAGTVKDSSGAVVPQAKITVQNKATNAFRGAETDASGTYRVTSLPPGRYDVLVEKPGFKTVDYSQVELTVGQVQNLDATLAPSAITEIVTVKGELVAPVDLNDAQIESLVRSQQIEDLPLILRDPYQLALLSPGAIQSNSLLAGLSVNGSRERNNNFLLDGTDNNDAEIPGLSLPQPGLTSLNPDAVQEFRVITSNFLPEFGRNTGAVVDVVTKRGTNDFHADAYWFGRYSALGARDFFNHEVTSAGPVVPRDLYVRNTFGASAGGAIRPDKTFWFANYEGQRFVTTLTNASTVPTAQFKSGGPFTFTDQSCVSAGNSPAACTATVDVRPQTFPNNNVFFQPLDPSIQQILALYPDPNGPKVDDLRGRLFFPSKTTTTGDNVTTRVDHNFTPNESLSVRYTFNRFEDPNFAHTDFLPGLGGTGTRQRRQDVSLHWGSVISQRLVNDLRVGGNRINFPLTCQGVSVFNGFSTTDAFGRGLDFPLPGISGFGCLILVDRNDSKRFSGTYTLADDVTWMKGRHSFKAGVEARDVYSNSINDFLSRPTLDFNNFSNFGLPSFLTFNPLIDANPDATPQNMVWSLYGSVGTEMEAQFFDKNGNRTADDLRGLRQKEFNAFFQDSYKARPNLTLSYGLRYQFNGVPYEVHDLLSTIFTSPGGPAPFTFVIAGQKDHGLPPLYNNDWHDFEPRVGIAWDPFRQGKTSIRAGYGIFHDRVFGQLLGLTRGNPPFQQIFFQPLFNLTPPPCGPTQIPLPPPTGGCLTLTPVSALPLPPPLTATPTVRNFNLSLHQGGILPFLIDPHLKMPYSQSWNFGVQHQLPANLLVEVNYVGSKGNRLLRVVDGNPPQASLVAQLIATGVPPQALQFDNLWLGFETGILPFDATNNSAFLHAEFFTNAASSVYHALQASVTKRLSSGLALQATYTWAHAIDNSSDPLVPAAGNQEFPRNSFDLAAERGNSDFDVRQRLVLNYTWDVPLGPGHQHLASGAAGKIFEGWQIAGITTFSGGLPFDIFTDLDTAHAGQKQRPDFIPTGTPVAIGSPRTQTGPNLGFFSDPPFGRGGNLGRNRFRGPGINNWDMLLQRTVRLSERAALQFRTEAYNVFNRVQFCQPDNSTADTNTFGQSACQVRRADETSGARQIQFGMKLRF
jgi:hypothetical protein